MATAYRIVDEPAPSRFSNLVVNPFWALLALMLGGAWVGFPWFAFNSVAIGSATVRKELALSFAGLAGAAAIAAFLLHLSDVGTLTRDLIPYAGTVLILWKLGIGYALHETQAPSFQLYTYFGGRSRKGLLVVIGGLVLRQVLITQLTSVFWFLVLT
jgi:hypothetical protein